MDSKGGVSPLKLRASKAKSRRGGEEAGVATAKTTSSGMVRKKYLGGRGGYKKSSGTEGTGVNRGGYNVHTRFKPRAKPERPKGGVEPTPRKKPYSFDKDGEIVINTGYDYKQDPDTTTTTERTLKESKSGVAIGSWDYDKEGRNPTYDEAWDLNLENVQDKYTDKNSYKEKEIKRKKEGGKGATKEEIESSIYKYETKTETTTGKKYRRSYQTKNGKRVKGSEGQWEEI